MSWWTMSENNLHQQYPHGEDCPQLFPSVFFFFLQDFKQILQGPSTTSALVALTWVKWALLLNREFKSSADVGQRWWTCVCLMQILLRELQLPSIKVNENSGSDEVQMITSIKAEVLKEQNYYKANCFSQWGTFIILTNRNVWPFFVRAVLMPDQIVHPFLPLGITKIFLLSSKRQLQCGNGVHSLMIFQVGFPVISIQFCTLQPS